MKFIKIGTRIINLGQIAHVEIVPETKRVGIWFVGARESLDVYGGEAEATLAVINAREIHVKDEALDKLMESLDLKS